MANVIRPFQLSCNSRVVEHDRRFYYTISSTLGFDLLTGNIFLEYDYLFDCISCMGEMPIPDPGLPKPNGEYLVSGKFFVPNGKNATGGNVSVKLGKQEKELYVFGPRHWTALGISKPEPISEIPIDDQHAFGGEGFEQNPRGMGYKTESLPCVEQPNHLITSKRDTPHPVGLGALDIMTPARARFRGNYDNYLEKYFPGYPKSMDWRFFLTAPENQWIQGFFQGDEPFCIKNMHPDYPNIEGRLPSLQARCFLNKYVDQDANNDRQISGETEFVEKKLNLDTVWLFPEKLKGMLIWRSVVEVKTDDAEEISDILVAYESLSDSPRDISHYRQALNLRLETPEDRLLNHFKTLDLIPVGATCAIDLMTDIALSSQESSPLSANLSNKVDAIQAEVEEKKQEALKSLDELKTKNQDMPEVVEKIKEAQDVLSGKKKGEMEPDIEQLMKEMDVILPGITVGKLDMKEFAFSKIDGLTNLIKDFMAKKKEEIDQQVNEAKIKSRQELEKLKQNPDVSAEAKDKINKAIKDLETEEPQIQPLVRLRKQDLYEPLVESKEKLQHQVKHIQQQIHLENPNNTFLLKQIEELGNHIQNIEQQILDTEPHIEKAIDAFKQTYVLSAHFMDAGVSPHSKPVEKIAEDLLNQIKTGKTVCSGDYACIDLSGQNLDGVNLSGSLLEQVNLQGASLQGANLSGCMLTRANLENANFREANLEGANIGSVQATGADFSGAIMNEAVLSKGNFTKANFSRCCFLKAQFLYTNFQEANFTQAELPNQIWLEVNFQGANLHQMKLIYNIFVKCNFTKTDFSESESISCAFVNSCFDQSWFKNANFEKSCFVGEESSFLQTSFSRGRFNQTNFMGMPLQGTDFSKSEMVNALFNDADLTDSNFSRAQAKTAQFRGANLTRANFDQIQLWEGSLAKAHLKEASFVNANLAYTDFLRCTIGGSNFEGANLDCTLIKDWRPS